MSSSLEGVKLEVKHMKAEEAVTVRDRRAKNASTLAPEDWTVPSKYHVEVLMLTTCPHYLHFHSNVRGPTSAPCNVVSVLLLASV